MAARDCRITCKNAPITRPAQVQIGAFSGACAILGVVATTGKRPAVRAGVAGVAAALGAASATALASYIAKRRCDAICTAVNQVLDGNAPTVDDYLREAYAWLLRETVFGSMAKTVTGPCADDDWICWAIAKLAPYMGST